MGAQGQVCSSHKRGLRKVSKLNEGFHNSGAGLPHGAPQSGVYLVEIKVDSFVSIVMNCGGDDRWDGGVAVW